MPEIGERKTKNGITGEWDGTTWRQVDTAASEGPKLGDRKTKNGVTGEWDGTTWRQVSEASASERPSGDTLATVAKTAATGTALGPAALAGGKRLVEEIATNPNIGKASTLARKFIPGAGGGLSVLDALRGVVTGRKSVPQAATGVARDAAGSWALSRVPGLVQRGAQALAPAAEAVGSVPAMLYGAGASLGAAVPFGFLSALERDVNREHDIAPTDNTPAGNIMNVFQQMAREKAVLAELEKGTKKKR